MGGVAAILEPVGEMVARRGLRRERRGPEYSGSAGSHLVRSIQVVGRDFGRIDGDRTKAALW